MDRFIFFGIFLIVAIGLALHFGVEVPWLSSWMGKLPGDIEIKKGNVIIYIPLTTSLLISALLSIVLSTLFKPSK